MCQEYGASVPEATVNGIRLYYEEHGQGPPILCIHGTASSAMVWGSSIEPLAKLGRVIAYDRRGCTRSERPEPYERTFVSEHADDAAALLVELDARPAVVVGRSYGGEIAIDLALRYPNEVRALALLEPAILNFAPEAKAWADELRDTLFAAAANGTDRVGETFIRTVTGQWESFPGPIRRMFTENGPAILAEFRGGFLEVGIDQLARIDVPTLLAGGSDSPGYFRQVRDVMASAMPSARTAQVPGGHLVNPADPSIVEFVRGVLAAA
jgi:pimeloyl-ACP methyl ester carboxylesterase